MSVRFRLATAAVALALTTAGVFAPPAEASDSLFKFDELAGVPRPFTGTANPIRGVAGGGLPWVLDRGEARLDADGSLRVVVEGLVFDPEDQVVIDNGLANQNPVPFFKAIVSCLSVDTAGDAIISNVETGLFPATTGLGAGDADIREMLALPDPCIAPIVFVTAPSGVWFAATGFDGL